MQAIKLSAIILFCASFLLLTGCDNQLENLRIQNAQQADRISDLLAQVQTANLELDQLRRQLSAAQEQGGADLQSLRDRIALLESDIAEKNKMIESMSQRLLAGGTALPVELSTLLEDFANANSNMVSYDSERGIVKFKSDLLFAKGSDEVATSAVEAVRSLCAILNTPEASDFDVVIAGHTDDIPIQRAETKAKHPTNWHLSADRAIAVKDVMEKNNLAPVRMSIRGFGEYRPVEPNAAGNKGNPVNRRVEVYIVPKGA